VNVARHRTTILVASIWMDGDAAAVKGACPRVRDPRGSSHKPANC
jgi:hypothetical protein